MKRPSLLLLVVCIALIAAVPGLTIAQEPPSDEQSAAAAHMHEHLDRITAIKALVVVGNLEGVREPAKWLAEHETVANLPPEFEPFVVAMRTFARQIVDAQNLKSVAASVSMMAQNCGNCHTANEVALEFGYDQMPAEWSDTETHMQRHLWAVDRMWEGMIGPSDTSWNRGTSMFVDIPLHAADVTDATLTAADVAELEEITSRVHELGVQGANAKSPNNRSQLFSDIVGLCADCHTKVGRGPGI